jgi:hypothetical protein
MGSITIHKLDGELERRLKDRARQEGISVNQVVKKLLRASLGLEKALPRDNRDQFLDLFGTWQAGEAEAFLERTADLEAIDPTEWQEGSDP